MKTSHFLLLGGGIAAIAFRDKISSFIEKQSSNVVEKVSSYAAQKVDIKPYKLPKIGYDLKRQEIKLDGSVYIENKSPASLTLNSYLIEVTLEKDSKFLSLGKTPLLQPMQAIAANSKTKVGYKFGLPMQAINSLVNGNQDLINYDMFIHLKNMNVSGLNLPPQKIAITSKWRDVLNIVKNPVSVLDKLFDF